MVLFGLLFTAYSGDMITRIAFLCILIPTFVGLSVAIWISRFREDSFDREEKAHDTPDDS